MNSIQIDNPTLAVIATSAGIVASTALLALTCRVTDCFRNRPAPSAPPALNDLPKDFLGLVRGELSPTDRGNLAQTCQNQAGIANQNHDKEWVHIADLLKLETETVDVANDLREAKRKYADICKVVKTHSKVDPKTATVEVVFEKYQEIYDQSLLIFANKVADALGNGHFTNAAAARTWFQDSNNQTSLQGITYLGLRSAKLNILPAEIGQLTQLDYLKLSNNKLSTLPAEIGQLTQLRRLDLDYNELSTLPAEIGQLTQLRHLDLTYNKLSTLPAEIGQLTQLKYLDLTDNKLSTLPAEIGKLRQLRKLILSFNELSTLPAEIWQLPRLENLDLSHTQLSTLPTEIWQLTQLEYLKLSNNKLSTLPAEIGQLTQLRHLNLYNNQLCTLPAEIGHLKLLGQLDLDYNPLRSLPATLNRGIIKEQTLKKLIR